ncbi:MAG: mucoidy inhibitor MuiA family protein [Candidatus Omnitrophica bacterium]|nr:mucoidy inhibitor MuiA family protein [Candidatus Omnitrophota bacterium]
MRNAVLISLVVFLALPCTQAFAAEATVDSKISSVMVFPDSCMVTRIAEAKLAAGRTNVVFADIIPAVDENSLKVSLGDAPGVKLLGAKLKQEYLELVPAQEVQKLKDQIRQLEDQLRREQDVRRVLADEKSFLDSLRFFSQGQLPKDLITKVPSPAELDGTFKFLDARLRENYSGMMESDLKSRENAEKLDVLRRELNRIEGPSQKMKRSIVVEVDAQKPVVCGVSLSYLAGGASWHPVYDARADFEKSEVELVSYAILRQTTGDDWQDVDVALSTARPSVGGNMPYVAPWILRPLQVFAERAKGLGMMREAKMQYAAFEKDEMTAPAAGAVPEEQFATVQEKGVAVVYTIPRKASIKSDGQDNKLPVSTQTLKASFEYSTFPRAVPNAFLGSRVTNAKDLQLLGGRVNIFLQGDFVGTSSLGNIGPGEEFDLYLGVDENVKVKREMVEKKVDQTIIGNIPSPNRKTDFKYKLTVENYKSRKVKVKLFEASPVSEDDRIKVKINTVAPKPKEENWKDRKGIWLWELELDPRQKQEATYGFTVEHPRDMQVEGL